MTLPDFKVDVNNANSAIKNPDPLAVLPQEKLAWMLQTMCAIRYFEEKAEDLYVRGLVHGTMHLSIGQEASSVGSIAALRPDDLIIHHHRGHGHTIAKGADLTLMMAEFLGKYRTRFCIALSDGFALHYKGTFAHFIALTVIFALPYTKSLPLETDF